MAALPRRANDGVDALAPVPLDIITPQSGSGVTTRIRDAILVLDKNELIVAIGKFAFAQNIPHQELTLLSGQQSVPPSSPSSLASRQSRKNPHVEWIADALGAITAMALDGRRQHVSICRETIGTNGATVSIHALKGFSSHPHRQRGTRLKTLSYSGADRFSGVAMSSDGKLVCCQSANANWTLVVWDWNRERQVAVSDVHCKVTRVRFNVIDMAQISTSGGNQLKLWTLSEYTLKSFVSFKSGDETRMRHRIASYTDHIWLQDDCLIALLEDGSVQLIINGELLQTIQALPRGSRAHSIMTQNNGEVGVMVGGSDGNIAFLRIVSKVMKAGEKELHLQRRMTMSNTEHIYSMDVDSTGSMLVCTTEKCYGSYDLSNQCLLLGDDEIHNLISLSSTPFTFQIKCDSLCAATRRPCFASLGKLPSGEDAMFVWNQLDGHECFVSQTMESHTSPTGLDIHPSGAEMVISFTSKVVIYHLVHDSVKVAFDVPAKHVSHVAYSSSGTHLLVSQSTNRTIFVYRSFCRYQREPELIATFHGVDDSIDRVCWSLNDRSFFYSDGGLQGDIRHCRLLENDCGEVDEAITIHSVTKLLHKSHKCVGFTSSKLRPDSHDYVLFAVEQENANQITTGSLSSGPSNASSHIRAWLNGDLSRDALISDGSGSLTLNHAVTTISTGPGKVVIAGTAQGLAILLYWRQGRLDSNGTRNIFVMRTLRFVDLHAASVAGLVYSRCTNMLLSCDADGVVMVSSFRRSSEAEISDQRRALNISAKSSFDEDTALSEPTQIFTSVSQADEIALYDRNTIELRKLRLMDIESELQQLKLENEMLNKQLQEQKRSHEERLKADLVKYQVQAESREAALKTEWDARLEASAIEREASIARLRQDAQRARDQYLTSTDKLQAECAMLRTQLLTSREIIDDLQLSAEEEMTQLRHNQEKMLNDVALANQQERFVLQAELDETKRRLREVLVQQDQDQMTQLSKLSSSVDQEKARATEQMSQIQGKMAALHQEVKMLLAALNQKDHELLLQREMQDRGREEISSLRQQLRQEKDRSKQLERDKQDLKADVHEQKQIRDNLQRLNNVHRSQIELLQKNLLPKERELEQMQIHLHELHSINQEVVVQANLADRLRKESGARANQNEEDVKETHRLLEHVRNSIVVLRDELGELVKQSAIQEKCAIVGEIMRIHKRMTRQMDVLQARDGRVEEVSAELHRQNRFLLKNKQHLRHQAEIMNKDKHKLVSALSFQNATLMNDINTLRKENKELRRMLGHRHQEARTEVVNTAVAETEHINEEIDGRRVVSPTTSSVQARLPRPSSASSSGPTRLQQITRRSSIRPKSAAVRSRR